MRDRREQIELWEQSLALLSDATFLDLIKNYIGSVPTPFHKPQLIGQLTTLFSTELFLERLYESLSPIDCKMLTIISLLETTTQDQLCSILIESYPYALLQQHAVNLEERLLVIPDPLRYNEKEPAMILNPLLEEYLLTQVLSLSHLYSKSDQEEHSIGFNKIDKRVLRALMSLHIHDELGSLEKSDKSITSQYAQKVFGAVEAEQVEHLLLYNRLLFVEKCIFVAGKKVNFDSAKMENLLQLDDFSLGALLFLSKAVELFVKVPPTQIHLFYTTVLKIISKESSPSLLNFRRVVKLALLKNNLSLELLDEVTQLLFNSGFGAKEETSGKKTTLLPTIDSDLSLTFTGELEPLSSGNFLHIIAKVQKIDVVTTYEINRTTLCKGFDYGLSVDQILSYLKELTPSLPPSLESNLRTWREEFSSITIYDGIVIKSDERIGRIFRALPALQSHIITEIDKNIFLMSKQSESTWREIIKGSGVGVLPTSIGEIHRFENESLSNKTDLEAPLENLFISTLTLLERKKEDLASDEEPAFYQDLRSIIESKSFPKTSKEELLARLERKLILIPNQIKATDGRSQTMEASGFDFQGKLNLCRSALNSTTDLIELSLIDSDGNLEVLLTEVKEYIRDSKESMIRVNILPEGEERLIYIEKVFKVRKLKRSIFFQT